MPVNARMALPAFLALLVWVIFNVVGIVKQGSFGYFKSIMFPPGRAQGAVPPRDARSSSSRPSSSGRSRLAVRLFANMLAGHLLLVSFAVLSTAAVRGRRAARRRAARSHLLVALTGFEVLVAFLQAYIFTILAAVYIGGAMHPEH